MGVRKLDRRLFRGRRICHLNSHRNSGEGFPLSETAFSIFADRVDFASGALGNSLLQNL